MENKYQVELEKEIKEYNDLVTQISNFRNSINELDANRLKKLGKIEFLQELLSSEKAVIPAELPPVAEEA